jgi:hypothetical protein
MLLAGKEADSFLVRESHRMMYDVTYKAKSMGARMGVLRSRSSILQFGLVVVITVLTIHRAESAAEATVEPFKGYRLVTPTARTAELVSVPLAGLRNPLVLEMGSANRPMRRVIPFITRKGIFFRARPSVHYQVWELTDYANSVDSQASAILGPVPGTTARARLRNALTRLRSASTDEQIAVRLDVSRALSALDGLVATIAADAPTGTPAEYGISPLRPLRVTAILINLSSEPVKARLARTVSPTDWVSTARTPSGWVVLRPHQRRAWALRLTASKRTYQRGNYPVIAWFDIRSGGLEWRTEDNCTLRVTNAKPKK